MKLIGTTDGHKVIASIGHHDYVAIGDIMHDGGQPGTQQYSGYNRFRGESIYFEVPQTYGELYTDYQFNSGVGKTRSYGIWNISDVKVLNPDEAEDINTFEYEVSQTFWGTRGINGDEPMNFVNLVDCNTNHLKAILDNQDINDNYKKIITHILTNRND